MAAANRTAQVFTWSVGCCGFASQAAGAARLRLQLCGLHGSLFIHECICERVELVARSALRVEACQVLEFFHPHLRSNLAFDKVHPFHQDGSSWRSGCKLRLWMGLAVSANRPSCTSNILRGREVGGAVGVWSRCGFIL